MQERRAYGRERERTYYFDLDGEEFKDSRGVDGGLRADAEVVLISLYKASVGVGNGGQEPRRP